MRAFGVDPIVKEGFAISARQQGNAVFIKLTGNGDMETPAILNGYLKKVHGEAMRVRAHSVIVECDELYFMSSACIKCLATWIDGIVKLDPMERYKVKFQSNANLPWQRRSFEALRRFAPALVHVDSDSAPKTPAAAEVPGSGSTPIAAQRATTPPSPLRRKT
jgi:hypothetical protein